MRFMGMLPIVCTGSDRENAVELALLLMARSLIRMVIALNVIPWASVSALLPNKQASMAYHRRRHQL